MNAWLPAAALAAIPALASAQLADVSFSASGTYWDTDDFGDAYGAQVGLELALLDWLAVEARTGYLRAERRELDIIPIEAMASLRLSFLDIIEPYAGAGAGHYFLDSGDIETEDRQAIFPLIGLDVHLPTTSVTLFAEARYMFFDDSVSSAIDSDLDGLAFSLGVSWSF